MNDLKNCSNVSKAFVRTGSLLPKNRMFKVFIFISIFAFMFACGSDRRKFEEYASDSKSIADTVSNYMKGISTDTINGITHNFIRKANLKFKVKDVISSSKKIEDIILGYGGYISSSELASNKNYTQSTQINKDSVLEQTFYTMVNLISIRIPSQKLDTVLRQISDIALFIDYRNLHSNDVKMKLYSNKLAENRYVNYKNRVQKKTEKVSGKQNQILNVEENLLSKQTQEDDKRLESFDLADQVNYSTINLEAYQNQTVLKEFLAIQEKIEPYQPSFFNKLGDSFLNGFQILKSFVLFLVNSWGIILILIVLFYLTKRLVVFIVKKTNATS
ncbi:MAG: DUF4349 domain-containing protein [Bacteroidota bacterium]|nr:DUF4349 domain-containing protein [Bacteroidota bacterium]